MHDKEESSHLPSAGPVDLSCQIGVIREGEWTLTFIPFSLDP